MKILTRKSARLFSLDLSSVSLLLAIATAPLILTYSANATVLTAVSAGTNPDNSAFTETYTLAK